MVEIKEQVMLRFLSLGFILLVVDVFGRSDELRDFSYTIDLSMKKDNSILDEVAELISESEIRSEIKKLSVFAQQDKPVNSMTALNDRLSKDMVILNKDLHQFGYYNAKVKYDIRIDEDNSVKVLIKIDTKNKFSLNFSTKFVDQDKDFNRHYSEILKNKFSLAKASMSEIRAVIDETLILLKNSGFYSPEARKKKVFIDYDNNLAFLDLEIVCGKNVNFGETEIVAFDGIDEQFIRNRLKWDQGEIFSADKINSSVEELKNTQIFSVVEIDPVDSKLKGQSLPMRVKVNEDKKHMLDIGLMYQGVRNMNFEKTSQATKGIKSIIAKISWTRLNAFGNGEKLTFNAEGTPMKSSDKRVDYAFEVILAQPDVFLKNATMEYGASHRQELTNVFFKKSECLNFKYTFPLTDVLFAGIGFSLEDYYVNSSYKKFFEQNMSHYYKAQSIPISLIWDQTDSLLNPTSGFRLEGKGTWTRLTGAGTNSLKSYSFAFSYNHPLDNLKKNVVAFRVCRKGIFSSDIDQIPIDKRLYGGGINSVRGYANQMATEMVKGAEVTMGGKALTEFNVEYRRKINSDWGAIAFFDGAKVHNNKSKYFEIEKKRWFFSVGAGMRYYTSIGPIRVDFAFPLNRRKGVDSKVQFIMGLGQSF
ncbi:MAG: BamA/TamA family outer membrane protein [Alphaproteobacteria bacterium]|nr:BamA/TamA family outer membrane protein [Alphaproteobacteria bacterium]